MRVIATSPEDAHPAPRQAQPDAGGSEGAAGGGRDFAAADLRAVLQELLEAEMTAALGAEGERTPERLGYRAGYYPLTLITWVG
jgi:transposase-like protein